jgi:hypothetical protein
VTVVTMMLRFRLTSLNHTSCYVIFGQDHHDSTIYQGELVGLRVTSFYAPSGGAYLQWQTHSLIMEK